MIECKEETVFISSNFEESKAVKAKREHQAYINIKSRAKVTSAMSDSLNCQISEI